MSLVDDAALVAPPSFRKDNPWSYRWFEILDVIMLVLDVIFARIGLQSFSDLDVRLSTLFPVLRPRCRTDSSRVGSIWSAP